MTTPVSGPGQFSRRTDKAVNQANRSLPNAEYGEQALYQEQLSGAAIPSAEDFSRMFAQQAQSAVVPLSADSQMPNMPVTEGAAAGAGAGPEVLDSTPSPERELLSNYMVALNFIANTEASDTARNLVRKMKYSM